MLPKLSLMLASAAHAAAAMASGAPVCAGVHAGLGSDGVALLQRALAPQLAPGKTALVSTSQSVASGVGAHPWTFYHTALLPLVLVTVVFSWLTRPCIEGPAPKGFRRFQISYLAVWSLAVAADWLQGPYVYALYESYGYSPHEISQLFVAGFGSSMFFGTFVGSLADSWGRKRCALLYAVLYSFSCLTKHCSIYGVLMVGRITGGIATSLLFSTFECWMISEHRRRHNFGDALLRHMLSLMFLVQYTVAVIAGLAAQAVAGTPLEPVPGFTSLHRGGDLGPFDLAILCLLAAVPLICVLWDENYGDEEHVQGFGQSLAAAARALRSTWRVSLIGMVVACFEGSMYSFVLNWTPALESEVTPPPHGLIFSCFMLACMCGSALFGLLDPGTPPPKILAWALAVAGFSLFVAAAGVGQSGALPAIFLAFLAFEGCVGVYFPAVGALKSAAVPEEARAGVYNAYRVPLNMVVVLLQLTSLPLRTSFAVSGVLLLAAMLCVVPMHLLAGEKQAEVRAAAS